MLISAALMGIGIGLAFAALGNLMVQAVPPSQTGAATGMNTVMRTLGGALGGQIVATLIADNVAHGLPTVTGFTESFALQAVFLVIAMLAGTLVPVMSEHRAATPVVEKRELVHAQELG
jgi:MFS family permease